MASLGVVLIHNRDQERVASASQAIAQFVDIVGDRLSVTVSEEWEQAPIVEASAFRKLVAWYFSATGDHRWAHYLSPATTSAERKKRRRTAIAFAKKQFTRMRRRGKRVSVARAVSAKNIRAWRRAPVEGWDFLLCVEDDIVLAEGASQEIDALVRELSTFSPDKLLFASVAQALSVEDIGAKKLITEHTDTLTWFAKPVSNTAAAYVVSRGLAEAFVKELSRHRLLAANPADWILNHLFMRFYRRGQAITCFHTNRGIFVNRSILGDLPSHTQV